MRSSGYYLPTLTKINKTFIMTVAALFVLGQIGQSFGMLNLANYLGASGDGFRSGFIFQPFTYFLIEKSFLSLLFNTLMIWFMGSDLEARFGQKAYLKILGLALFIPGLIYCLISGFIFPNSAFSSHILLGLTGLNFTFCMAQATMEPNRVFSFFFVFPMRAIHFCGLLVLMELYSLFFGGGIYTAWVHLMGMALGWIVIKGQKNRLLHWYFSESSSRPVKKAKISNHLKLIKPDDKNSKPPHYWQ